ncbi:hypothetical protein GCM10011375_30830 [Hymenobacter qilianensis]|uniref:Uncharacterized protein n=2 Tax=Hymenobacter qilianensis TaxID=1385715 RepID=A0ACB5PUN8_9BACT|nr:sodium:calcium antiporter [Hymenobacter qilianensis]QNP51608.1 sodium:calcium antiporter [Hymenobacter qilianensis]GGF73581.1 hypothetical protein GCM10011375_30830 [Hymenobacter qilianensis]
MLNLATDILGFLFCTGIIVVSGTKLSKYGDQLAILTGISRAWLGLVLLASVTSLPELLTSISAVAIVGAPDLAMGNILGSCAFNILILAWVYLFAPQRALRLPVSAEHTLSASLGVLMLSVVGVGFLAPEAFGTLGWMGGYSVVLALLYFLSMYSIFQYGNTTAPASEAGPAAFKADTKLQPVVLQLLLHAGLVVLSALALPYFSEHLAEASGLGESFFGSFFLAITTSLPEIVVSLAAVRLGSIDMALGNLFGSNLFNLFVLSLSDMAFLSGPIIAHVSTSHLLTVMGGIILTALSIMSLLPHPGQVLRLSPGALSIVLIYGLLTLLLYHNR